jgi:DNA-binding NarL/FixJ family response regulator
VGIVIADDHQRERTWLRDLLQKHLSDLSPIYEAEDGKQAYELSVAHQPVLAFLDVEMPILSGIKSAESIIRELPHTGIIILSNHSDEVFIRKLWKIVPPDSAFAYVLKDSTDQQVVDAARSVLSGDCWIHPRVQRIARRVENGSTGLTDAEFQVLVHIAMGLTDKAIAKRLYITEKAVQARLKCLYTKMNIPTKGLTEEDEFNHRCRALNIGYRRGLINRGELEDWEENLL